MSNELTCYPCGFASVPNDNSREDLLDQICKVTPEDALWLRSHYESLTELVERETYAIKFNVPKLRFLKDE